VNIVATFFNEKNENGALDQQGVTLTRPLESTIKHD
jgi:hypothetical protein